MRTSNYSEEFKKRAVQKLLSTGTPGLNKTAENIGIPSSTLFVWRKKYVSGSSMKKSKSTVKSWTPDQKIKAIYETSSMNEQELGEYLRKHGLHSSDIKEWKEHCKSAFMAAIGRPKKDPEVFELRKKEKYLRKDLQRKEKALAEMSARVVLLKKSHEIFGDEEDDE